MDILINDHVFSVSENATVSDMLIETSMETRGIAIAVNQRIIPRGQWEQCFLEQGDRIILIHATAGG